MEVWLVGYEDSYFYGTTLYISTTVDIHGYYWVVFSIYWRLFYEESTPGLLWIGRK